MASSARCLAWAALLVACTDKAGERVAELVEASQVVQKNRATSPDRWSSATAGDLFVVGDAVRTQTRSAARLRLSGGGGLRLGENSLVRFGRGDDRVALSMGEAEVEAGGTPLRLHTGNGVTVLDPGSRARLVANGGDAYTFTVVVGNAVLDDGSGNPLAFGAGQGFAVQLGKPVIENRADAGPPDAVPDAAPDAAPASIEGIVLAMVKGKGTQAREDEGLPWKPVAPGKVELKPGTALKVGARSSLEANRGDEKVQVRGVAEIVIGPVDGPIVEVRRGGVTVVATTQNTRVDLPGGSVIAKKAGGPGSRGDFTVVPKRDTQVAVRSGSVELRGRGMVETLASGESAALTTGGDIRFAGKPPDYADFSLSAGESPTIHDPKPPTAVRIRFGQKCEKAALVELTRRGRWERPDGISRGEGAANVLVPRGGMQYRVRCIVNDQVADDVAAKGTIQVLADRGVAPIPKRAPKTIVDADGRRYTVLYQNLLPELTFRWRRPSTTEVQLKIVPVRNPKDEKTFPAPGAQIVLQSGDLGEGRYQFWFEALDDPRIRSTRTTLVVDFDNAAATASVREPSPSGFKGAPTKVSGVVLEGWSVSVGGIPLPTDAQLRFNGDASPTGDEKGIAIRFQHPSRGVHYYLRRRAQ